MTKRMLIDASHPEETRVAIVNEQRLDDFDFETSTKVTLKGNIYLAKVIRVEPSLQAAFVDYGGNRHGFLAFNEIHSDYFHIPVDDRKILAENSKLESETEVISEGMRELTADAITAEAIEDASPIFEVPAKSEEEVPSLDLSMPDVSEKVKVEPQPRAETIETIAGKEDLDELRQRAPRFSFHRAYKIQEVIKRNQILLVQVVKEERGGKGAALTTYLSLPGRYCVLMPNTSEAGGISRKITSVKDRKKMREILDEMQIPESMSMIIRTAGKERSKADIKKDAEYLFRLWDRVRETTLNSVAPALVYEEANLIKRAIRDFYTKDIEEIIVEGEEGYKNAKEFMRSITPSHTKRVQLYKQNDFPLFYWSGVEEQIDLMHKPQVHLPSGGYLVINATEALVAIDINSGRATRERHIHETALKTNLEACDEIARQLRLRDLAGLIVIDFIDMDDPRHSAMVERRLREAMQSDRARIQMGSISPFGLLELSRQRLRPSIIEFSTIPCAYCQGTGVVRSTESSALEALRALEEAALKHKPAAMKLVVPLEVALYVLNQKRAKLIDIEARHKAIITVENKGALMPPNYEIHILALKGEGDYKTQLIITSEAKALAAAKASDGRKSQNTARRRRDGREQSSQEGTRASDAENRLGQSPAAGEALTPKDVVMDAREEPQPIEARAAAPRRSRNARRRSRNWGRHRLYPQREHNSQHSSNDSSPAQSGGDASRGTGERPNRQETPAALPATPERDASAGSSAGAQKGDNAAESRESKSWWQRLIEPS